MGICGDLSLTALVVVALIQDDITSRFAKLPAQSQKKGMHDVLRALVAMHAREFATLAASAVSNGRGF